MKMLVFLFKNTYNNKEKPLKVTLFAMSDGCPYFLNKSLDKAYSKLLRSYDKKKKKKIGRPEWTLK